MAEEGGSEKQVKIKLVIDSDAKTETEKFVKDTKDVKDKAKAEAKKDEGFLSKSAWAGAGGIIGGMVIQGARTAFHDVIGLAEQAAEAYREDTEEVRAMAGAFALIDDGTHSMAELKEAAQDVAAGVGGMVARTGQAGGEIVETFTDIVDRGYMSVEMAQDFTEQMAYAGKAIPGGMKSIAAGIDAIQLGMVKAKNPVVAMIASTGLLQGNAKQVAKEMSKLTLDKQMELASKAIDRTASQMKELPLTLSETVTVLGEVKDQLLEAGGKGLTDGLTARFGDLRTKLFDKDGNTTPLMDGLLEGAAKFGDILSTATELGGEFAGGLKEGWDLLADDVKATAAYFFGDDATKGFKDSAKALGVTIGGFVSEFVIGVTAVAGVLVKAVDHTQRVFGEILQGYGATMPDALGGKAAAEMGNRMVGRGYENEQQQLIAKMTASGVTKGEYDEARKKFDENRARYWQGDINAAGNEVARSQGLDLDAAQASRWAMNATQIDAKGAAERGDLSSYFDAFAHATAMGDEAAQTWIASVMSYNKEIAEALTHEGPDIIKGGKDNFLAALRETNPALAAQMGDAWKTQIGGAKPDKPINFNHNKFEIKQEFKDTDPDRIAVTFTRAIERSANSRIQTRVGTGGY